MRRYVAIASRPRASHVADNGWYDFPDGPTDATVYEQDRYPVDTGLLDATGTPPYRVEDRMPLGFDLTPAKRQARKKGRGGKRC